MDGISRCVTWAQASNWRLFLHSEAQETRKHFHRRKTDTYLHDILSKLRGHSVTPLYPCHNQTRAIHTHQMRMYTSPCAPAGNDIIRCHLQVSSQRGCMLTGSHPALLQMLYELHTHTHTAKTSSQNTSNNSLTHTQRGSRQDRRLNRKKLGMFKIRFDFSVWEIQAIGGFVWMFHCSVQ